LMKEIFIFISLEDKLSIYSSGNYMMQSSWEIYSVFSRHIVWIDS